MSVLAIDETFAVIFLLLTTTQRLQMWRSTGAHPTVRKRGYVLCIWHNFGKDLSERVVDGSKDLQ